jgi:hypothetical protein
MVCPKCGGKYEVHFRERETAVIIEHLRHDSFGDEERVHAVQVVLVPLQSGQLHRASVRRGRHGTPDGPVEKAVPGLVDGGINPAGSVKENDVCINGMYLSYACHFGEAEESIGSVVEFILKQCMADGGWYRAHTQGRCISRSRGQAGRVVGTR